MTRLLVSLHHRHHNKTYHWGGTKLPDVGPLDDGYDPTPKTLDELIAHIQQGYAWVACTLQAHPLGKGGWRHSDAAGPSNLIVLDVDGDLALEEFWGIPFVQRHCLFTSTTCSHQIVDDKHPDPQDRYRAVFPCEELTPELHPFVYRELLIRLDLTLKDDSGEKPERLWYGNDKTIIRKGDAELLSYELIEDARDAMSRPRPQLQAKPFDDEYEMDCKRICYLLLHLLPVSCDEEYVSYWQPMLAAAIAANDEEVWEAFLDWNKRGHHYKKNNDRRCERERSKGSRSHMGKIMKFARERLGEGWHKLLPPELQYRHSGHKPSLTLYKASSASGQSPEPINVAAFFKALEEHEAQEASEASNTSEGSNACEENEEDDTTDPLPPPAEMPTVLYRSHDPKQTPETQAINSGAAKETELSRLLDHLYQAVVNNKRLNKSGDFESIPTEEEADMLILRIRCDIAGHSSFLAREPWRIERHLFNRFLREYGFPNYTAENRRIRTLAEPPARPDDFIIPNLIARGRCYLLYGKQGTGKTTFALMLARAALGTPGHNQFLDFPAPPIDRWGSMRILYIATDGLADAYTDLWNYVQRHNMGQQEWTREYLHVLAMDPSNLSSPWKMELPDLRRLIDLLQAAQDEGIGYGLVIIDSLKAVCPSGVFVKDQIVLDYVNAVYAICSRYNAASLFLHHQSKEGDTAQGVTGLLEQVSGVFRIKNDPEKGRVFMIDKTRTEVKRTEIPYVLRGSSLLSTEEKDDDDSDNESLSETERRSRAIANALNSDFTKWRMLNSSLDPSSYTEEYPGLTADILYSLVESHFTSRRVFERTLQNLCKTGMDVEPNGNTRNRRFRTPLVHAPGRPGQDYTPGF